MQQEACSREGDYGFHRSKSSSILSVTCFSNEGWGRFSCSPPSSLLQRRDLLVRHVVSRAGWRAAAEAARANPAICESARDDGRVKGVSGQSHQAGEAGLSL